jgi:hypothetical protein
MDRHGIESSGSHTALRAAYGLEHFPIGGRLAQVRHGGDDFGYFRQVNKAKLLHINKRF